MEIIYISLPITGHAEAKDRAEEVRTEIQGQVNALGLQDKVRIVTPFDLAQIEGATYGEFLGQDIAYIVDSVSAIYFDRGYATSKGCMIEQNVTYILEMTQLTNMVQVTNYLQKIKNSLENQI